MRTQTKKVHGGGCGGVGVGVVGVKAPNTLTFLVVRRRRRRRWLGRVQILNVFSFFSAVSARVFALWWILL